MKEANSGAMSTLGSHYYNGSIGLPINMDKGVTLWTDSACMFQNDQDVKDKKKALYYFEKAAILGNVEAMCFLGDISDTCEKAITYFAIAAKQSYIEYMTKL